MQCEYKRKEYAMIRFNLIASAFILISNFSVQAKDLQNCELAFKEDKSPILASHLFDTGDYFAIETGDWSKVLKVECLVKEKMMKRVVVSGVGFSNEKVECIKYEMTSIQKEELNSLAKKAKNEKLTESDIPEDALYITTMLNPNSSAELMLQGLSGSPAIESVSRKGSASKKLIELIQGMCAFAN